MPCAAGVPAFVFASDSAPRKGRINTNTRSTAGLPEMGAYPGNPRPSQAPPGSGNSDIFALHLTRRGAPQLARNPVENLIERGKGGGIDLVPGFGFGKRLIGGQIGVR